jgi:hypothetical protein
MSLVYTGPKNATANSIKIDGISKTWWSKGIRLTVNITNALFLGDYLIVHVQN